MGSEMCIRDRERDDSTLGLLITNQSLLSTSCDHLIKFCVDFPGAKSNPYFNLEFPYEANSSFVFLGEVTFLNGGTEPCDPPELITMPVTLQPLPTSQCKHNGIPSTLIDNQYSICIC